MKTKLIILFIFSSSVLFAQNKNAANTIEPLNSLTRTFIDSSNKTRINKDWSFAAQFKSGIGETVTFFPVQIIDLDTKKTINAIQLDMMVKQSYGFMMPTMIQQTYAWIDYDEIDAFISFIENNIKPNLDLRFKEKSSEFIFQAKEITLTFLIYDKARRLTIKLNNNEIQPFWTETQVDNFPQILPMLKVVKNKELKFE